MIYLGITIFLLNTLLGVFTFYKKRTFESLFFSIFATSFGIWALSIYATIATSSLFWGRTAFFGAILGMGSILLFSLVFPNNKEIGVKKILAIAGLPLFLGSLAYSGLIVRTVEVVDGSITGTFGPLMALYKFYAPAYIFGSIYIIFKKYKTSSSEEKLRIFYAILGISSFIGPAVLTNAILPLWFDIYSLNSIGPLFSVCMVGFISYAIIKHQFLDIKVIIQRSLVYTILLTVATSLYLLLIFTFQLIFQKSANELTALISALITTIVGIFGVPLLQNFFKKITDPFFFKDAYDYREVLDSLTEILNKNIDLKSITRKSEVLIENSLRVSSVSFSLYDKKTSSRKKYALSIPIVSNSTTLGNLNLGIKKSGDAYSPQDVQLLETFAKQAAVAIEKASLYEQVKEQTKILEKKVEERTSEILKIQKNQELMMLEISHGLQTPLTIMKGELFFLRKQGYDTTRVDVIDNSIDRVSSFIYRLLELSHIETSTSKKVKINLSELVEEVLASFFQPLLQASINLTVNVDKKISIQGNKEELFELFSNLMNNAIKYTQRSVVREITVSLTSERGEALFSIKDTGIGMRKENLERLFQKFYRIKEEETKGISGTGLGLAICKKITELHGGYISVESTQGEGSTFFVRLPTVKK